MKTVHAGGVDFAGNEMITKHQGTVELKNDFTTVFELLRSRGEADLATSAGSSFAAKASIAGSGEHSGEPVIKFFHDGVEYARSYRCCWGHYYNCYRTRIGMYCKALDDFLDGGSSSGLHFQEGVIILKFKDALIEILRKANRPLTPQEIRTEIKDNHPQFCGTDSHRSNVAKGHYKDLDHALLAQIYSTLKHGNSFSCDTSCKPMKVKLELNVGKNTQKPPQPEGGNKTKNEDALISNIEYYYKRSLDVFKDFGGPSVYFHVQAIKEQESNFLSDRHIEMIYATLASWGMHKMGDPDKTKAKMVSFTEFKKSILTQKDELIRLSQCGMHSCTQGEYATHIDELKNIYYCLKVSISEATIVAHSKTLAHILPNLVPPLDRQYTVRFFTQEYKDFFTDKGKFKPVVNLPYGIDAQFHGFKYYCCRIKALFDRCDNTIFKIDKETFNTSYPKIMDNCIMAFVKDV